VKGNIEDDSKLVSAFPFIGHVNPDNNIESLYIIHMVAVLNKQFHYFNAVYFGKSPGQESPLTVVMQINIIFRCVKNFHLSTRNTI
jgi:hypothetical protein